MHEYFTGLLASRIAHKRSAAGLMSVCGEILRDEKNPGFGHTQTEYFQLAKWLEERASSVFLEGKPLIKQLPVYRDHLGAARVVRLRAERQLF